MFASLFISFRRNPIKAVIISVVIVYLILTLYHLSHGFGFGDALTGGLLDVRAVFVCFGEWGEMKEFIARPAVAGRDLGGMLLDTGVCW